MPRIALITAKAARSLDDDLAPLVGALRACGTDVSIVDWDDDAIDWSAFDCAVLRSTWDYAERADEFLGWCVRAAEATRLINPLAVVRWNIDKRYLADLEKAGVGIVPTEFVDAQVDATAALERIKTQASDGEFVIKPAIGAGSRETARYAQDEARPAMAHARRLLAQRRSILVQPYLRSIDLEGETALIYFDGTFSHAIRKGPLLKSGAAPTHELFARETIEPRTPGTDEFALGEAALAALPFDRAPVYARVDLVRDAQRIPRVLEVELIEPSLFFNFAERSAQRFAACILDHSGVRS